MANEPQKEMMMSLLKTLNDASKINERLKIALDIGGAAYPKEAYEYLSALNSFLMAGLKILLETNIAFGDTPKETAIKFLERENIEN